MGQESSWAYPFVNLYVQSGEPNACKKHYIACYGLTARQFNAIAYELAGRVNAAEGARKHRIATLERQIAATERPSAACRGRTGGLPPARARRRR